jgi:hypothetical protein
MTTSARGVDESRRRVRRRLQHHGWSRGPHRVSSPSGVLPPRADDARSLSRSASRRGCQRSERNRGDGDLTSSSIRRNHFTTGDADPDRSQHAARRSSSNRSRRRDLPLSLALGWTALRKLNRTQLRPLHAVTSSEARTLVCPDRAQRAAGNAFDFLDIHKAR